MNSRKCDIHIHGPDIHMHGSNIHIYIIFMDMAIYEFRKKFIQLMKFYEPCHEPHEL